MTGEQTTNKYQTSYHLRLTINTLFTLLAIKLWFFVSVHSQMNTLYLVSFVQDTFLLITTYFLFIYCTKRFPKLHLSGKIAFYILFITITATSFIYTFFLLDLFSFPINIFGVTADTVSFFIEYFLNWKILLALPLGFVALFGISRYFPRTIRSRKLINIACIVFALLFIPTVLRPSVSPIIFSFQEQLILAFTANENIVKLNKPVADNSKAGQFQFLNKSFVTIPQLSIKYNHVVVLVMEGINYKDFKKDSERDPDSFYNKHRQNIINFTNYYTLNLDSYTSLVAMLNSIFVPYQAYVNESNYAFVSELNNLTRFFNANNFETHFITSYGSQQERFVPNKSEWTQKKYMDHVDGNNEYTCITSSKIEYACEDLAVFDDMINILKTNKKTFVFQEMVYGHTAEWKLKTGIETIDYYNRYFNKTIKALKENNLLDNSLLVVVSDHGPRDNAYTVDNYQVPLMIYAKDIEQNENKKFLSHLDLKDILLELIADVDYTHKQSPIYTMGNSGELIYGMITQDGKHAFINNRMRHSQDNLTNDDLRAFNKNFQAYMNYIEYLKQKEHSMKG